MCLKGPPHGPRECAGIVLIHNAPKVIALGNVLYQKFSNSLDHGPQSVEIVEVYSTPGANRNIEVSPQHVLLDGVFYGRFASGLTAKQKAQLASGEIPRVSMIPRVMSSTSQAIVDEQSSRPVRATPNTAEPTTGGVPLPLVLKDISRSRVNRAGRPSIHQRTSSQAKPSTDIEADMTQKDKESEGTERRKRTPMVVDLTGGDPSTVELGHYPKYGFGNTGIEERGLKLYKAEDENENDDIEFPFAPKLSRSKKTSYTKNGALEGRKRRAEPYYEDDDDGDFKLGEASRPKKKGRTSAAPAKSRRTAANSTPAASTPSSGTMKKQTLAPWTQKEFDFLHDQIDSYVSSLCRKLSAKEWTVIHTDMTNHFAGRNINVGDALANGGVSKVAKPYPVRSAHGMITWATKDDGIHMFPPYYAAICKRHINSDEDDEEAEEEIAGKKDGGDEASSESEKEEDER